MKEVFKFGGSVVTDATAIKKIASIIKESNELKFVVLSATFNTTNRLERTFELFKKNESHYIVEQRKLLDDHLKLARSLSLDLDNELKHLFIHSIEQLKEFSLNDDEVLDHFYSIGELSSSLILAKYLNSLDHKYDYLDIRGILKTNDQPRNASPLLFETKKNLELLDDNKVYITQGFIGSCKNSVTRTLGREGSDYTGAILAWCMDAESLTIWKDVKGIYNCDPNKYGRTQIINKLSYRDASILTAKGAKVLFPKTMEPLEAKNIKLNVRSVFSDHKGTLIGQYSDTFFSVTSLKYNESQVLVSLIFNDVQTIGDQLEDLSRASYVYEQGPSFISYLVSKQSEESFVNDLLQKLDISVQK